MEERAVLAALWELWQWQWSRQVLRAVDRYFAALSEYQRYALQFPITKLHFTVDRSK